MSPALIVIGLVSLLEYPPFEPPTSGAGAEVGPMSVRSIGMGGISTALESPQGPCFRNPAASAWADRSGLAWSGAWRTGDDEAWDDRMRFPYLSVVMPLPLGLSAFAGISERSLVREDSTIAGTDYRAGYEWHGGLNEATMALSVRVSGSLALALGARSTFGTVESEVVIQPSEPGPGGVPLNTIYLDEAMFEPSTGLLAGAFLRAGPVDLGLSLATDRRGDLTILRDYASESEETVEDSYDVPGEFSAGVLVRPAGWLSAGAEYHARKTFHIPGAQVPEGSVTGLGVEVEPTGGLALRAGWSSVDGLWRDGAVRFSAGAGYTFGDGLAGLDVAVTRETWDGSSESGIFFSLWSSEGWLGIR